jgi:hypothetical protein
MNRIILAIFVVAVLMINSAPAMAQEASTSTVVVSVIKVDIQAGKEETLFTFKPDDFKSVQVIRRGAKYLPNNFEIRGILKDDKDDEWIAFVNSNKGCSIRTQINNKPAAATYLILSPVYSIPLGVASTKVAAYKSIQSVAASPQYIDQMASDDAREKQRSEKEIAGVKKSQRDEELAVMHESASDENIVDAP